MTLTLAETLADALADRGVARAFGIPGGGSSLDLIDAFADRGIDFVLTQTEAAAAIMAAVTAEISGTPGVVLTGVGPGAASAVNGIAYASLERQPVVLITDCKDDDGDMPMLHQAFDQVALYAPLTKAARRLHPGDGRTAIEDLLNRALAPPRGPVHVDLTAADAAAAVTADAAMPAAPPPAPVIEGDVDAARALLAAARKPVIIAGMQARDGGAAEALGGLARALDCPVMLTYKAKGVMADTDPRLAGLFTGAAAEDECVGRADLMIFFGLDPVELIARPWRYDIPVLDLAQVAGQAHPVEPRAALAGPLPDLAGAVLGGGRPGGWDAAEIAAARGAIHQRLAMAPASDGGLNAEMVVEAAARAAPDGVRLTVDAGAHMFSTMARWTRAARPFDVLKSNGLSTMAFAVPAAIAAALHDPGRPVVALTGDGGVMMCLGELATAARLGIAVRVVVLNDAALSLIDIKQQRQQRPSRGVRYARVDIARTARGLGLGAWRAEDPETLAASLGEAFAGAGPTLVDAVVDPAGYAQQLENLRG